MNPSSKTAVEVFVAFGVGDVLNYIPGDDKYEIVTLSSFPDSEENEFQIPPATSSFCLPNNIQLESHALATTEHSFVLTLGDGNRIAGTCLTTWVPLTSDQTKTLPDMVTFQKDGSPSTSDKEIVTLHAPVCLCLLSRWPYWPLFSSALQSISMHYFTDRFIFNVQSSLDRIMFINDMVQSYINKFSSILSSF